MNLAVGKNTITIRVEAEDGTMATYTVEVTRAVAVSTDAVLTDLTLAQTDAGTTPVTLSPTFVASTTSYTAIVYDALNAPVDKVAVTATVGAGVQRVITPADADAGTDGHQVNLRVGETTIRARVTVSGATQTYTIKVTRVAASDATLSALSLSAAGADLSPKFDAGTEMYTASVANSVTTTDVTATPTHAGSPGATATPIPAATGVALNVGENTIKVVVRAVDGTTKTYTIVVTRAGSAATLSDLTVSDATLAPVFDAAADPMVYEYTASVANSVDRVTVTATKDATAKDPVINPADADAASDTTHEVDLEVGKNVIEVMVEAQDGSMKTFTITVTRAGSPDATLSGLTLSDVTLAPVFAATETTYTATVPRHVDSTTVAATSTDTAANVEYMPADADMATKGHQVALGLGETKITVMVTSSDMTTTSTYTITVNRRHADASLKSLSLGDDVALTPAFDAGTMSYSTSVASTVGTVTVMAAPTDADATVEPAAAAAAGETVTLDPGDNTITLTVTSSDGTAQSVYTVKVFQVHAAAHLTALSLGEGVALTPEFSMNTIRYTANVDHTTMHVTVAGTPVSGASVAIQDADGEAIEDADEEAEGHQVPVAVGETTIVVAATGGDPAVTTPYTVVVTRPASSDASLSSLSLSGLELSPAFASGTYVYSADAAHDVASTTVSATATHADASVSGTGVKALEEGANTFEVVVTAADESSATYSVVVNRAAPPPPPVRVPGPTVTVPGPTRTVTRTVTQTVEVEVPAPPNVIGGSMTAMATEVDGRVLITRHDGGASLVVDIGGFIRDESLGQTYQVVRRMDGMIVRQWVSPNSPLVYQIPWSIVNTQFTVPVGVILSIPLDDQSGSEGQLVRRFDGGDDRIFSYAGMGQWRHIPDIATLQALGYFWCDVTAADSEFFNRITIGAPHPASDQPARSDYPNCSTG